jgi:dTDP-4-dehydrorhamnose 3,5-epimerase
METFEIIKLTRFVDQRGSFTRIFDQEAFDENKFRSVQVNISSNPRPLTLRGLHFQIEGPAEKKYISLIAGSIFLVLVDLRRESSTFSKSYEIQMNEPMQEAIYVPNGFATGWLSLSANTTLQYIMSARYEDCKYSGIRFNDQTLSIKWPYRPKVISSKDQNWPSFLDFLESG